MQQIDLADFVVFNSLWRNLVLLFISAVFVLVPIAVPPNDPSYHWGTWEWADMLFFGSGVALFGLGVFDRRPQIVVDQDGIEKCRSRVGRIPWSEISAYRFQHVKGNLYITLSLRNPEVWKAKCPTWSRHVARFFGSNKLEITISLQNMVVDEEALQGFMTKMIKEYSLDA